VVKMMRRGTVPRKTPLPRLAFRRVSCMFDVPETIKKSTIVDRM
jgi:hypothetical protein